jgi:hypothetical protein
VSSLILLEDIDPISTSIYNSSYSIWFRKTSVSLTIGPFRGCLRPGWVRCALKHLTVEERVASKPVAARSSLAMITVAEATSSNLKHDCWSILHRD